MKSIYLSIKNALSKISPGLLYKIGVCLLPILVLVAYSFISGDTSIFTNLFKAVLNIKPRLILNSFLAGIAFVIIFLCGFRVYGWLKRLFNKPPHVSSKPVNPIETILSGFVLGSLFIYLIFITVGILGFYYQWVLWILVACLIFFPAGLKNFLTDIKNFLSSLRNIKIKTDIVSLLILFALIYLGLTKLLIQFTSPFPPTMDAMEVYVGPVTRVLNFHQYQPDYSLPSAHYNASRAVPLHTGFYSFISSLTGLKSYESEAASPIFILLLALAATYHFARIIGGKPAGAIALWLFAASSNILHITDGRSGVYTMFYFLPGLAYFIKMILAKQSVPLEEKRQKMFFAIMAGVCFGLTFQMHPVVGAYVIFCTFLVFIFSKIWLSINSSWEGGYTLIIAAGISMPYLFQLRHYFSLSYLGILLIMSVFILLTIVLVLFLRFMSVNARSIDTYPLKGRRLWFPVLLFPVTLFLLYFFKWKTPIFMNEAPLMNVFRLSPFLLCLGVIAVMRMAFILLLKKPFPTSKYKLGITILLVTGIFISFSSFMYILPLFKLEFLLFESFSMELAAKALEFFILPLLVIIGAQIIVGIKKKLIRYSLIPFIIIIVTLPVVIILGSRVDYFAINAQLSIEQAAKREADVAANGYFIAWDGDPWIPVSKQNRELMNYMNDLVSIGDITLDDTITHIAYAQESWIALPFPVFTGIKQTLIIEKPDPFNCHVIGGRLYELPKDFDYDSPPKWVLLEKNFDFWKYVELNNFLDKMYEKKFENERISFFRLAESRTYFWTDTTGSPPECSP